MLLRNASLEDVWEELTISNKFSIAAKAVQFYEVNFLIINIMLSN
jgi:hypothetical protein